MMKRQTELPYILNRGVLKRAQANLDRCGHPGKVDFVVIIRKEPHMSRAWELNAQRSLLAYFNRKRREARAVQRKVTDYFRIERIQASTHKAGAKKQLSIRAAFDRSVNGQ